MMSFEGHPEVYSLTFSPSMPLLVSGDYTGKIKLWDLNSYTSIDLMPSRNTQCYNAAIAAFSSDGTYLATAPVCKGDYLRIWEVSSQRVVVQSEVSEVTSIAWSPDNSTVACGSEGIILIEGSTGKLINKLTGFPEYLTTVSWSLDGHYVAGGTNMDSPTIMIWDIENFRLHATLPKNISNELNNITQVVLQDHERLIFLQDYGIVYEWNIQKENVRALFDPKWKYAADLYNQLDHCCTISSDGELIAYAQTVGKEKLVKDEHGTFGLQIEQVEEGQPIHAVYVANIATQEILNVFEGHAEMTTAMTFNQHRNLLATGDIIGELYVWDLTKSKPFE